MGHLFTLFNLDLSVLPQGHEQIRSAPRTWISFYLRWWLIDRVGWWLIALACEPG